jgi:hypothetical protein
MSKRVLQKSLRKIIRRSQNWSIGIYVGDCPLTLRPPLNITNPVLTADDVTDIPAEFVADPFMVNHKNKWYMFFEVFNLQDQLGDIALATSDDGFSWTYEKVVLDENFHLSYPYVFRRNNEYYMIPETYQDNSIRLYKSISFPHTWSLEKKLLEGYPYVDTCVFNFKNLWWLFTSTTACDTLRLFYSHDLYGPWVEHPKSPIIENDSSCARPGGRVTFFNGLLLRYTQDDKDSYGARVHAFVITELTTESYHEEIAERSVLCGSGTGWNKSGMHHVDPHRLQQDHWLASVDGCCQSLHIKPGLRFCY